MNDQDRLLHDVLSRIAPTPDEQQKMQEVADGIISSIDRTASTLGLSDVKGMLVGSAARGTWITGEHDLDIFISFPDKTGPDLKTVGLEVARKVVGEADRFEERYAEHPYIHAYFNDFEVDLVPCFRVSSAACIKSAVDRTPFHNQFILSRIKGLEDEVLLLKQFMKGAKVYGSDLRTGGFSGYLAELLVIYYGSFSNVLIAADNWKPGTTIDINGHGSKRHNDPLVVVDPTDPARNVAAALTIDRFAGFVAAARKYLESPKPDLFFPASAVPMDDGTFEQLLARRGTSLLALVFDKPDIVDDILYPQLFMLQKSIQNLVERHDFRVISGDVWAGDNEASVIIEILANHLPPLKKHQGPPVFSKQNARDFKGKYEQGTGLSDVYIEKGRYMVDIPRKYTDASALLRHEIHSCKLGKHVGVSIRSDFRVLQDAELLKIGNNKFREFLTEFFHVS